MEVEYRFIQHLLENKAVVRKELGLALGDRFYGCNYVPASCDLNLLSKLLKGLNIYFEITPYGGAKDLYCVKFEGVIV